MIPRKASPPWQPAIYEDADVYAVQALARGEASAGQQKRVLEWILLDLCQIRDLSFWAGEEGRRVTDFAEGKRFVGLQIGKLMHLRPRDTSTGRTTNEGVPIANEPRD